MDYYTRKRIFSNRAAVVAAVLLAALGVLVANLFSLQISNHDYYRTLAEGNRFKLTPSPPPRGLIYDRNGRELAVNRTVYKLELTPSLIKDLPQTVQQIGGIIPLNPENVRLLLRHHADVPGFQNVVLRQRLDEEEVARLAVDMHRLNGVEINGRIARYYPQQELFAHLIGYVGLVSKQDKANVDPRSYYSRRYIGKTGVEKFYEKTLHGRIGSRKIEVNASGRPIRMVDHYKPLPGHDLLLTVDSAMQKAAFEALGEYSGAVVVMDTRNGDVLALVSRPSFDPNLFSYAFSEKAYGELQSSALKPFFNRAISGQYPPGSTIKPIVALAALENRTTAMDTEIFAGPYYQLPGHERHYRDWRKQGHGWVNLSDSITQSCDVFFYDISHKMGIGALSGFMRNFGLGQKTGIDLSAELAGLVPDAEWKRRALDQPWFPAETIIAGIGQGYVLATPLQMAAAAVTIANRGHRILPRVVKAVRHNGEWKEQPVKQAPAVKVDERHWDYVINAMEAVVHKTNGTAYRISDGLNYTVAGKTGTMQLVAIDDDDEEKEDKDADEPINRELIDHGMFIAFAPAENPEIAVTVLAENSGSGAIAATLTRKVLDAYFADRKAPVALKAGGEQ